MRLTRASGVLLHPTSLPGGHGIGDLGAEAHAFVDFLASTGQRWWQMLPLGPTGYGNSPYQSHSSFAGNPLLIDLTDLVKRGWLEPDAVPHDNPKNLQLVDFDQVTTLKEMALRKAFERFQQKPGDRSYGEFLDTHSAWLDDYAFYHALKDEHHGLPWYEWEPGLVNREPGPCASWRERIAGGIAYHRFVQYVFDLQWQALRDHCRHREIGLIGDLPIFVAHDSADVWANPKLFDLDGRGQPLAVAGVPPDYFSATGQLWGNPLYRWEIHAADGYAWWTARLRELLRRVDLVRIDHFRGFEAYWEIPAGAATAASGHWVKGPGAPFFEVIHEKLGSLPLIAEDLGMITPEVEALRDQFNLPGMRVLQFGFGPDAGSEKYLPHRYVPHCFTYTGTHDNDTTRGWFLTEAGPSQAAGEMRAEREYALRYANTTGDEIHWGMIRLALASVADTAIVPLQDILGLDGRARMNFPGKSGGYWRWRFMAGQIDQMARQRLAELTANYGRWNGPYPPGGDRRTLPSIAGKS